MTDPVAAHARVPEHVPPELVYPFNQDLIPEFATRPFDVIARVRREAPPVFYTPTFTRSPGGAWVVTRAHDTREGLQHPEIFTREDITHISPFPRRLVPLEMDPPEHGKYRALLAPLFSPKAIDAIDKDVAEISAGFLDKLAPKGGCELMEDFARPYPATVFMKMMGLPMDMQQEFVAWEKMTLNAVTLEGMLEGGNLVASYLRELIAQRRKKPENDIITRLTQAEVDGKRVSDDIVEDMCFLLFIAGLDTVTAGQMHIWNYLASHPERKQELVADPTLIRDAVEEMLRYHSWIPFPRHVTEDTDLLGVGMKRGDRVMFMGAFASNDPEEFPEPDRIDFTRDANRHLCFAGGVHRCAGSHLARREIRISLAQWLQRMPDFSLAPDQVVEYETGMMFMPKALELRWTPA